MEGWIDGDWVDGDWILGIGPVLVPSYWSDLYWPPGYWDPHYWGLEPIRAPTVGGGRAHKKPHFVPSVRRFVVSEDKVRAEIRAAIAKAALAEENRQRIEHEDEEYQRRDYYRKLGMMGVAAKQKKAKAEDEKNKERLRNLEKGRRTLEQTRRVPPAEIVLPPMSPAVADRLAQERTRTPKKADAATRIGQLETKLTVVQNALDRLVAEREQQEQIKRTRLKNLEKARKSRRR